MARIKENTLSERINLSVPAIQLPRTSVHDAYALKFNITVANASGAAVTPTAAQILGTIEQVVLTSDSTRVHYALSGMDIARRNAVTHASNTDNPINKTFSQIANSASGVCSFVMFLDEGDILAFAHDSLELKVVFNTAIDTGVTVSGAEVITTIIEKIPTADEVVNWYGKNLEMAAEPKVYANTVSVSANTEFSGILDLPTGTLLTGAMLYFSTAPETVGILQTVPDRVELIKIDWDTMRAIDERKFRNAIPTGVIFFDYGLQWYSNGLGVPAWTYNKGDRQIAVKSTNAITTFRYVSFERMVDTVTFDKLGTANIGSAFV